MRKQLTFKIILAAVAIILLAAQGTSWYLLSRANQKIQDAQFANRLTLNELDQVAQQQALSPIPGANRLYLAELNLTIPLTATASSIRYSFDAAAPGATGGEARLTSAFMTDHTMHTQSCSDMVRLKIEPKPNAYSPDQPLHATVKLTDGRVLQVYASTTKECQLAWRMVSPQSIAEVFKAASVY